MDIFGTLTATDRTSAVFVCVQEAVAGVIVLVCKEPLQHHGISLSMEGVVNLQLSSKSVGVFEAFYNSVKVNYEQRGVEYFQLAVRRSEVVIVV